MGKLKYATQNFDRKSSAFARINNADVSLKIAIEICNMIRYKTTENAKKMLGEVIEMKKAVPYKRFNKDVAHKKGIGPGRYPIKAAKQILDLVKLAESNAESKGLSSSLVIKHLVANKGNQQWHYGRKRRRKMKNSHIEIILLEKEAKKAETPKEHKKHEKKAEEKAVALEQEEPKADEKKAKQKAKKIEVKND